MEQEEETITTASLIPGQKISLIDGNRQTWATTFVVDVEPEMPSDWPDEAKAGDYILVRGGVRLPASTVNGSKPMKVSSNWRTVKLFPKPLTRDKITGYQTYPGVLQHDWAFFQRDMTPACLMRTEEFLVDLQHVDRTRGAPSKKK